jgi:hypothetical protein
VKLGEASSEISNVVLGGRLQVGASTDGGGLSVPDSKTSDGVIILFAAGVISS